MVEGRQTLSERRCGFQFSHGDDPICEQRLHLGPPDEPDGDSAETPSHRMDRRDTRPRWRWPDLEAFHRERTPRSRRNRQQAEIKEREQIEGARNAVWLAIEDDRRPFIGAEDTFAADELVTREAGVERRFVVTRVRSSG